MPHTVLQQIFACTIYCPESASGAKLAFIQSCYANLVRIEGAREKASEEALMRASEIVYGSHVWNPWFLTGVRTLAYELFQQMENLPEEIVMPLGNGALLLGVYQGFLDLKQQQLIREIPALIGVQAEAVAPIYHLWKREKNEIYGKTLAEGIANALPPRAQEIVTAVETSGGRIMKVNEQQIMENWKEAIKCGLLIEPTSAVVLAAESMMPPSEKRLHILTGSLLKTPDVRQKIT